MRSRAVALLPILAVLLAAPGALAKEPILISVDHAKVMRISRPADTVIIGNPAIADATIKDSLTLILTGRSFGTTNLIVLDDAGQPIADELLTVQSQDELQVTVFRRSTRETFSCTPICEPTLVVGDDQGRFDSVNAQVRARGEMAGAR